MEAPVKNPLVEEQLGKHRVEGTSVVGPERRAFLEAALHAHLGAELAGDLPAIVDTFSKGGHLNFNGVVYDTPERLTTFHKDFGWDGRGMLSGLAGEIVHLLYTHDSVVVEYLVRATVAVALCGAPAGRPVSFPMCVVYEFDEAGKLASERGYADSAALLPQPILPL
jgi:predicted ester cyclase